MQDTLEYLLCKLKQMLVIQPFLVYTELFLKNSKNLPKKKSVQVGTRNQDFHSGSTAAMQFYHWK